MNRHRGRRGFSLLEILLALSILGGSLAVLSQVAEIGSRAAREARDLAICRLMCQSKLSELLLDATAGISPQSVVDAPLESFDAASLSDYRYRVEVWAAGLQGLLAVRVTVKAVEEDGETAIAEISLNRWVVDPTLGLEQAEADQRELWQELNGADQ
jgi:prepilin-type N-terminal cleavage/methylation domain-containing protein